MNCLWVSKGKSLRLVSPRCSSSLLSPDIKPSAHEKNRLSSLGLSRYAVANSVHDMVPGPIHAALSAAHELADDDIGTTANTNANAKRFNLVAGAAPAPRLPVQL